MTSQSGVEYSQVGSTRSGRSFCLSQTLQNSLGYRGFVNLHRACNKVGLFFAQTDIAQKDHPFPKENRKEMRSGASELKWTLT
jgi:hypothetical protein